MRRLEKFLLSKVPVWIVVPLLTVMVAGTVVFGALVRNVSKRSVLGFDSGIFPNLASVVIKIAKIPEDLSHRLFDPYRIEAVEKRFDGRAGLYRTLKGGMLLPQRLPKRTLQEPIGGIPVFKLIDLSGRKTLHVWNSSLSRLASTAHVLSDGSLIVIFSKAVVRLDACSNVEWRKRWKGHHSIEWTAGGSFWMPVTGAHTQMFMEDELLKFSSAGETLT